MVRATLAPHGELFWGSGPKIPHHTPSYITSLKTLGMSPSPAEAMSAAASEALGKPVDFVATSGGGASGGGGATTSLVFDKNSGIKYFVESARNKLYMLMAEYLGVKEMANTNTIQVPTPVAFGEHKQTGQAFAIFEFLELSRGGSQFELGVQLAKVRFR